jgi:hypothetical protein
MDEIVKQAMAKWPNVPHCFGWLALDARGAWRMRDERSQAQNLPGDKIGNATLLGFINRNYMHDDNGRWYFQNGPQRVYIDLEATPYIAHTDPAHGFVLHTGEPFSAIEAAWITESGRLILKSGDKIAMLDDRDIAQCLTHLRMNDEAVSDEQLLEWLAGEGSADKRLTLVLENGEVQIQRIKQDQLSAQFGFVARPRQEQSRTSAS